MKETFGANGTLLECIHKSLDEGLWLRAGSAEFEIERVHCLFAPLPDLERLPRPVLIRFLRESAREKFINAEKEKQGFIWEGCRLI